MRLRPFSILLLLPLTAPAVEAVSFSREIRPILSENCFACHGPDENKREAKLRLDEEASAKAMHDGAAAVVPGSPEKSALIERIETKDPDDVMPPLKMHKTISPQQLTLLKTWIKQGAKWGKHWAYEVVAKPAVPKQSSPSTNPVDAFLAARLVKEKLSFSPEADRPALARRVALDITGLPPTTAEVDAFVNDRSSEAYSRMVDQFLAKPAYGEHWARMWLDLARYADSAGYPSDPGREIWAYRDWVIKAMNSNMPFDEFTIDQIAGDLLPKPTDDELIATAFHRNTMTQNEGGTNDEEFRNAAVIDRTNTTMAVWMGTSMACAQCHSHKYDPITNKEYFQFYAFMNQSEDSDKKDERPLHSFYTKEQQRQRGEWQAELAQLEQQFAKPDKAWLAGLEAWATAIKKEPIWRSPRPTAAKAVSGTAATIRDDSTVLIPSAAAKDSYSVEVPLTAGKLTALRLEAIPDKALPGGHSANGSNFVITQFKAEIVPKNQKGQSGRFVRVEIPGKGNPLHLAEVQVFSNGQNIALKGKATQSGQYAEAEARRAIDGKTNGDYYKGSVSHTADGATDPWWEVELPANVPVDKIVVWNRTDGKTSARLKNWRVLLLDDKRQTVWSENEAAAPKLNREFVLTGIAPVNFASATATLEQPGFPASAVLAAMSNPKTGWAIAG
ncbi:MAG: Planctomycete cytochrome, partial [Verrucomicrobiaceae bacterium]|nr:Planctomycete cytochrome [Verrucomicrobiaceae bacterium]